MKKFIFYKNFLLSILQLIGSRILCRIQDIGVFSLFIKNIFTSLISRQIFFGNIKYSFKELGFNSIPMIGWTGFFTGCILALQLYYGIAKFGIIDVIPNVILISLFKEMGPMLVAIMLVARVGSSITAEIAGMKVNNQLDTLISLSVSPYRFVYIPRILALTFSTPILTLIACIIGLAGSYVVCVYMFHFPYYHYIELIIKNFEIFYLKIAIVKGFIFGFMIAIISCFKGKNTTDGAVGIGRSTISSVVLNSMFILLVDLIITYIMENL